MSSCAAGAETVANRRMGSTVEKAELDIRDANSTAHDKRIVVLKQRPLATNIATLPEYCFIVIDLFLSGGLSRLISVGGIASYSYLSATSGSTLVARRDGT